MEKRILKLNFEQRMREELQLLSSLRVGVLRTGIILHQTGPTDERASDCSVSTTPTWPLALFTDTARVTDLPSSI